MTIYKVLITAAFAVVVPVGAFAQSATEPAKTGHSCAMMASGQQAASAAAQAADAAPMACCQAKTAQVDHSAHTPATTPPAPGQAVADPHAAHAGGNAAGCCGDTMAAGDQATAGKEGCCAAMERKACCTPKEGDTAAGCCAHAQASRP